MTAMGMELEMGSLITHIDENSPAAGKDIKPGDKLIRINGHKNFDVLDYKYYSYDARLLLEIHDPAGKIKLIRIVKPDGTDLGLTFESYLMDSPRSCANRCIFCFVDQLPKGLRETLYFKDDDNRLSFLQGNYVTLTNLADSEIQRMIDMRLSPLNISVHATEPELHSLLLGNKKSRPDDELPDCLLPGYKRRHTSRPQYERSGSYVSRRPKCLCRACRPDEIQGRAV
jgi:putative radical SAM enzyme (TIGR03279 family)